MSKGIPHLPPQSPVRHKDVWSKPSKQKGKALFEMILTPTKKGYGHGNPIPKRTVGLGYQVQCHSFYN